MTTLERYEQALKIIAAGGVYGAAWLVAVAAKALEAPHDRTAV